MAVATDPGGDLLVEDQFRVLMPAVRERHHEDVRRAQPAAPRVQERSRRAKVHLGFLAGGRVHSHYRLLRGRAQTVNEAADRGVAAAIAALPQPVEDRHHLDPLRQELLYHRLKWLHGGRGAGQRRWWTQHRGQRRDVRDLPVAIQIAGRPRQLAVLAHRLAGEVQVLRDLPLALTKPEPMDEIT